MGRHAATIVPRTIKHEIEPLDGGEVLRSIRDLPLYSWRYQEDPLQAAHVGPMAEDVHAAFGIGRDDKHLSPADSAGLALAAIQGVDGEVRSLRSLVETLLWTNAELASENRALEDRLVDCNGHLDGGWPWVRGRAQGARPTAYRAYS